MTSARRPPASRPKRQVTAVRKTAAPPTKPVSRATLTTRSALLGLVLCGLVVSAAIPLREYLTQRSQIADAAQQQSSEQLRVDALQAQLQQLKDPAYLKAQARQRLHFVLPGETAYVVLTPAPAPAPTGKAARSGATATAPGAPWYSQLWGSVQTADQPGPLPSPTPAMTP